MDFPSQRFRTAGATDQEIAGMEAAFTASSELAQASLLDSLAPAPASTIEAMLENFRAHNASLPAEPEPVVEPAPTPDPAPATSGKGSAPDPAPAGE